MPVITTSVQNMAGSTEQRINKELKDKNCDTDFLNFQKNMITHVTFMFFY